jgi:hypothetical protein
VKFTVCPHCGARYPVFSSPPGTLETLCEDCGWCSDSEQYTKDMRAARGELGASGDGDVDE